MSHLGLHRFASGHAALRALPLVAFVAVTATLASALQIRQVRVAGARRFPAREIETALRHVIGSPALQTRADELRNLVRTVPWVADATVHVSLDGIVSCLVSERVPVAVAVDGGARRFLDAEGRLLAPAGDAGGLPELAGWDGHPEERAAVLAAISELQRAWDGSVIRIDRVAPNDALVVFAAGPCPVLVDPGRPGALRDGRRALTAWQADSRAVPARLDVRVPGRIAILPAAPPVPPEPGAAAQEAA